MSVTCYLYITDCGTHVLLTACLSVHISYRTHPNAQISLTNGEENKKETGLTQTDKQWKQQQQ